MTIRDRDRWERQVTQAVTDYAMGNVDGDRPGKIGASLSPWKIAGAINQLFPQVTVLKVELKTAMLGTWTTNVLDTDELYQMFQIDTGTIEVEGA